LAPEVTGSRIDDEDEDDDENDEEGLPLSGVMLQPAARLDRASVLAYGRRRSPGVI